MNFARRVCVFVRKIIIVEVLGRDRNSQYIPLCLPEIVSSDPALELCRAVLPANHHGTPEFGYLPYFFVVI